MILNWMMIYLIKFILNHNLIGYTLKTNVFLILLDDENLQQDVNKILIDNQMNTRYVKTYNKSKHKNYTKYYNKSTRKRVFEIL